MKLRLTNKLTPWSRVILEKLTVYQLVKKYPVFMAHPKFITAFTRAHQLSLILSQSNLVHASLFHFLKLKFNIIFPSTRRSSMWSISIRSLQQNSVCISPVPHTCHMSRPSPSWFDHPSNIWWELHIMKLLIMQSSLLPCYLVYRRLKYIPMKLEITTKWTVYCSIK